MHSARSLLLQLSELNLPAATEFLDPITPLYLSDLISWSAIGARTAESQLHRQLASGLNMPVGFKNNTDGNTQIAIDGIKTANHPQHFLGIHCAGSPAIIQTTGNRDCHMILRGSRQSPNYSAHHVTEVVNALKQNNLPPHIMIDCSHGNSNKNYLNQIHIANDIAEQIQSNTQQIVGIMLESNLVAGKQALKSRETMIYGQSITDACLSWGETLPILERLAKAVDSISLKGMAIHEPIS